MTNGDGRRTVRQSYAGRRVMSKTNGKSTPRTRRTVLQLGASALLIATLVAIKTWSPGGSAAVSGFVETYLSGGADYHAALTVLGECFTGEASVAEVWSALNGEQPVHVSIDGGALDPADDALPASTVPEQGSGGGYFAQKLDASTRLGLVEEALYGEEEPYVETATYLTTEDDEDEEELTGHVSYDFIQPEFDYMTPVDGVKTSGFGYRIHPITGKNSFHYGIDIGAPSGADIVAFADGTIELVDSNSVYGNYLFIRHKDGFLTFYGHCKKVIAQEGQLVRMGDTVAHVGSTGWSTGPHLHFEVRSGETILDPTGYVSFD